MVTYNRGVVADDDAVFRALADPTRRALLDRLRTNDGQTQSALEDGFDMTRFGVAKHLKVLDAAGLVIVRKVGREKRHYLNPVPIQRAADRWVGRFREAAGLLSDLTDALEASPMTTHTDTDPSAATAPPAHVLRTMIRTTPETLWRALTESEFTTRYYYASTIESTWQPGAPYEMRIGGELAVEGEVVEADPPRRLVQTFRAHWEGADPSVTTRVTWEIEPADDGVCILSVVHDGFSGDDPMYADFGTGWVRIVSGLKTLLETGEPMTT